jgi:hypothetical protein
LWLSHACTRGYKKALRGFAADSSDGIKGFIKFIQDNMRPQPEVYAKIRQVNAGLTMADDEEQEVMDLGKNECAASMHPK